MNINKKYAIRKLTVGIASVSIGLFVCNTVVNIENPISTKTQNVAKAEETTNWQPQGNIVAQGVDGVAWELYENGYLLFKPHNGNKIMEDIRTISRKENSWRKYAEQIKAIGFSETIQAPVDSEGLFSELHNIEHIETEKLDVSNVVNMEGMFFNNSLKNQSKIKELNVSNWNVSNVVNMNRTFMGLNNLKSLDVDNWKTSKVKDMYAVFQGLHELNELKMSNFDTTSITSEYNSSNMFVGLRKLLKIKLGDKLANGTLYNKVFLSLVPSRISVGDIFLPDVYTERWVKEDGTVGPYTYEELYSEYKKNPQKMTGTWVREKKITSYTVNFTTNSSENISNLVVEKNTQATLPTPTVDKPGYKFLGWSKTQDGDIITNTTNIANPGETITLYAKWEKVNNITTKRVPIEPTTVYQGDNSIDQGARNEEQGQPGLKEVITTYQITPITGELTNPTTSENIITPMKPKVVKVGTKPSEKVETLPSPRRYEKDDKREKDQENIIVQGRDGSKTTRTTYTVNPNNGEITSNVGEPVIIQPTNTIVKVAAKDKVVYSKDGDNIVKETTIYEVNPENGNITENTTRVIFKENGAKDKIVVERIPSPVRYEKDDSREKGQEGITVQGRDGSKTTRTTYTVNPETGEAIPHVEEPVIIQPTNTIIKVAAKDKVIYSKDGDNIVKETTVYTVNPDNGNITENKTKETFKENGAKDKVVVETLPSPRKYEKDDTREKGQENITVQGKDGSKTTRTTYTVNPETGEAIPHVGEPLIVEPTNTIIKVAAKDKVIYLKDGDNIVKEITTYTVNPENGNITENTTKEIFKENGAKDKVVVEKIPASTRYEKDNDREKGQENVITQGKDGTKTTRTTFTVNPETGEVIPHVEEPVIVEPTNTIIKVAAKDKVIYLEEGDTIVKEIITYEVNPETGSITENKRKEKVNERKPEDKVIVEKIPSPIKYEKDSSREKGQENITVQGKDGSKTTTITYTVNPKTGEVEEHPQEPVTVEPTNTIIKVALKDKVVFSKDGDNIVKETTTYEINPENGKITENTTKEIYKENGAKDKVVVEKIPALTRYEKDDNREKGQENVITQGKDGSKTTRTTFTVNPETGEVIPHVEEPIIVNPTNTIIKVAAKDKVIYVEEGDTIIKEIITYEVNPETGSITENKVKETVKENGLKDKVVVETIPSPMKYEKDSSREKGQDNITVQGKDGTKTTTITYTVNPNTGEPIPNPQEPIIVEPTSTIIKVAAKDKVEIVTKKDGSVVKEITTYEVNPNTGEITETKKEEVIKNKTETLKGEPEILESPKEFVGGVNPNDAPIVEELPELKVAVIKDNKGNILEVIKENEKPKEIDGYKNTGKVEIDKDGYKVYIYEKIETQKPITKEKQLDTSNKEDNLKDNKETINKKEELPKTSSSMLSTVGLLSIFGLRKNRKKNK